ncbi:tryptophan 2,3-dioxygenase [Salinarimonas ramus]|uniref:Tryptophan 2,3-dioxygenase n=1 Tax=Salinarimonas ramus TaxID=690164 RepID=A0A917QIF1_9HYPH|nr:tryptophan 2,3-dioxygenase [Salinarimonas ramus]GGK52070.1 tryptophan 2,3-dioxygenase [Salinarimonas ramus]
MADDGVKTDFSNDMSYGDYLGLDTLLAAQHPLSAEHDEPLFIAIHQVQELWMKLFIHELDAAISAVRGDRLRQAFKALARCGRIQEQLVSAWDVLSTMTPADYLAFRERLGASSGFQSFQYRMIEFKLGAKAEGMLEPHAHDPARHDPLRAAFEAPSIYDEAIRLLARRGLPVPADRLTRDVTKRHEYDPELESVWEEVYRRSEAFFDLYELAEELVDLEDLMRQWRFRHVTTVERIIGFRRGTGGSAGVSYLKSVLEKPFFPELWQLRTKL